MGGSAAVARTPLLVAPRRLAHYHKVNEAVRAVSCGSFRSEGLPEHRLEHQQQLSLPSPRIAL
jgi:hypothetical protein